MLRTSPFRRPVLVALALAALAGGALPACTDDRDALVVYSGRTRELISPLLERFAEETGIDVDVNYDDSANLALTLAEEGDNSPADVFISQSPGATGFLDAEGLLARLPADVLELVPSEDESDAGTWVGLSGRLRTLVYNTDEVDPAELPRSVLDLTDPRFKGQLGVAPTNGSFQDFVTAMRDELGDDRTGAWLEGLADNDARPYPNNLTIVEAVGRGEISYGLVNHYYLFRVRADDPDVPVENHFFPQGDLGSSLLVSTASVLASSSRSEDAERLVEFLLSDESQRYFAEETFEYPLVEGIPPAGDVPPLSSISVTRIDLARLGGGLTRTAELIDRSGIASG